MLGCRCVSTSNLRPQWRPDSLGCALLVAQPGKHKQLHLQLLLAGWQDGSTPQWAATVPLDAVLEKEEHRQAYEPVSWAPDSSKLSLQLSGVGLELRIFSASGELLATHVGEPCGAWQWAACGTLLACLPTAAAGTLRVLRGASAAAAQPRPLGLGSEAWSHPSAPSGMLWAPHCEAGPLLLLCPPANSTHVIFVSCADTELVSTPAGVHVTPGTTSQAPEIACSLTHVAAAQPGDHRVALQFLLPGPQLAFLASQLAIWLPSTPASDEVKLAFSPCSTLLACCGTFKQYWMRDHQVMQFWLTIVHVPSTCVIARLRRSREVQHGPVLSVSWVDSNQKLLVRFAGHETFGRTASVFSLVL